jgi:hypothetical protein
MKYLLHAHSLVSGAVRVFFTTPKRSPSTTSAARFC